MLNFVLLVTAVVAAVLILPALIGVAVGLFYGTVES